MPRKTCDQNRRCGAVEGPFNEAAARCRGKPWRRWPAMRFGLTASMRPRPDAAENLGSQ